MQFPALYQQGPKNLFYDWFRIFGWMANDFYSSLIIFSLTINIVNVQPFRAGGETTDMNLVGTIMLIAIIWIVNVQIAMKMSHLIWIQHLFVWGSIATRYIFLIGYGLSHSLFSDNECQILVDALPPAPIDWLSTLLIATVCNLPYLAHFLYQ